MRAPCNQHRPCCRPQACSCTSINQGITRLSAAKSLDVQVDCIGSAQLYVSPDLVNWSHQGTLASQVRAPVQRSSKIRKCQRPDLTELGTTAADDDVWQPLAAPVALSLASPPALLAPMTEIHHSLDICSADAQEPGPGSG